MKQRSSIVKRRVEHCYTLEIKYLKKHLELYRLLKIKTQSYLIIDKFYLLFNLTANLTESMILILKIIF